MTHDAKENQFADFWEAVRGKIDQIDNPKELLQLIHEVEIQVQQFYTVKGRAFERAKRLLSPNNGKVDNKVVKKLIDGLSYRGRQFYHYAQLGQLIEIIDRETAALLDQEGYWLDAVRRKPSIEYLQFAAQLIREYQQKGKAIKPSTVRQLWDAQHAQFSPIIKPTDNWNFVRVFYQPNVEAKVGYIPGEMYANCFWYFVKPGDVVVDPMAGSGMAFQVYKDRERWLGENKLDFQLLMFDLHPLQPQIKEHDLLTGFPVQQADYIFLDPPYWGRCKGVYSDDPRDLSNMSLDEYIKALHKIARHCAEAQKTDNLCTVLMGNYTDVNTGKVLLLAEEVRRAWEENGYNLYRVAYASRHSQQAQNTGMAMLNNKAKRNRTPLTDVVEILTFIRV